MTVAKIMRIRLTLLWLWYCYWSHKNGQLLTFFMLRMQPTVTCLPKHPHQCSLYQTNTYTQINATFRAYWNWIYLKCSFYTFLMRKIWGLGACSLHSVYLFALYFPYFQLNPCPYHLGVCLRCCAIFSEHFNDTMMTAFSKVASFGKETCFGPHVYPSLQNDSW